MKTGRYNLRELLTHSEIEQIIIPEIQRDYVWGKDNVERLLNSIYEAYKSKDKTEISLLVNNEPIKEQTINQYLQLEYERLKFNHKIGFIYAYHDHEYAGKFFLIDGQQRITTLYLLLLNLYKKCGRTKDFKEIYFPDNKLKVDYRVREAAHDFLTDFVSHILSDNNIPFLETNKYYKNDYQHDETIKNLLANYAVIDEFVNSKFIKDEIEKFLEYVENFIELNYFDTHLSEQGEQLYIYMNSRGENLSYHEIIKSAIIDKIDKNDSAKKKEAGKLWEDWQNFFWQHKGSNENADVGFQEFLKWATIIEICVKQEQIKEGEKKKYISRGCYCEQDKLLEEYQKNSKDFNIDYLKSIFNALKYVVENIDEYISYAFNIKWLSNDLNTIDYVVICPLLYYIAHNNWQDEQQKLTDIRRLAMFLKNLTYFESTLGRDPDTATVNAMGLIKEMVQNEETDITYFLNPIFDKKYSQILTEFERYKLKLFSEPNSPRDEMEIFIWELTLNNDLSKFTEGNFQILFKCYEKEKGAIINYSNSTIEELKKIKNAFLNSVYSFKDDDLLRRTLLTFGDGKDYLLHDGSGYAYSKESIARYSFVNSDIEWRKLFDSTEKVDILVDMFLDFKSSNDSNDFKKYAENRIKSYSGNDWKEPFIKKPELLNYGWDKMILWQEDNRIILLKKIMTRATHGEIQTFLLVLEDENFWLYDDEKPFVCVYDFKFENNEIIPNKEERNAYAIDIWWEKGGNWKFLLFHRNDNTLLKNFESKNDWKKVNGRYTKTNEIFHTDDPKKSIMKNVKDAKEAFDKLLKEIKNILSK